MTRSLWPREHGAYAQLAVPLAAALLSRAPGASSALFAVAACAAFLANEPLLVVLGHRGRRMRDRDGARALRRGMVLAVATVVAGGCALALANNEARVACAIAAAFGAALAALAWTRGQHSIFGELVAAAALPAAAIPVAVASGEPLGAALATAAAWSIGFACGVLAVQRVLARRRGPRARLDLVVAAAIGGVGAVVVATGLVVATPLVLASLLVALSAPPSTRLREIGVSLVCAAVAAGGIAIAVAHHAPSAVSPPPRALVAH